MAGMAKANGIEKSKSNDGVIRSVAIITAAGVINASMTKKLSWRRNIIGNDMAINGNAMAKA